METEQSTASATPQESVAAAPNTEAATTTETPPSEGQTATAAAVESTVATPEAKPTDYRSLYDSDPALKAFVEGRAGDIANRHIKASDRKAELQRLTKAADDPVLSLEDSRERLGTLKAEMGAEDGLQAKRAGLERLIQQTAHDDPEWGKDYEQVISDNPKEAGELFHSDPDKFQAWADKKIYKLNLKRDVDKELKDRMPTLVEAAAMDKTNQAMGNLPQMPIGNGGTSDTALLASVKNMSGQEYLANKERIYAAIRRKQE